MSCRLASTAAVRAATATVMMVRIEPPVCFGSHWAGGAGQVGRADVLVAVVAGALLEPLPDGAEHGQVQVAAAGGLLDQRGVLGRQRQPEGGLEVALGDGGGL